MMTLVADPQQDLQTTVARLTSAFAAQRPIQAARLALRTRSTVAREAMARCLLDGELSDEDLLRLSRSGQLPGAVLEGRPARMLAALAQTWAGQGYEGSEVEAAASAYLALWEEGSGARLPPVHHQLAVQALLLTGQVEHARRLLPQLSRLPASMQPFLDADLANPWARWGGEPVTAVEPEEHRAWEQLLAAPFTTHGLAPLRVPPPAADGPGLFDGLAAPDVVPRSVDGPLVTVIVPCFRPDAGLLTAVASLAAQSHGPLEVLLVDDASGPGSEEWFEQALALDERVRLIRRRRNGGSYLGRNDALRRARGELVTFQDDDDWSHPERIAAQVALLRDQPATPACHTLAVRVHDDLTHQWFGYRPVRTHASSLMVRREVVQRLGGFLRVRKGADSEYAERIEAEVGPVGSTEVPMAMYRLRQGSLSRSDLSYHWVSPERLAFRGSYRAWLRAGRRRPFPAPLPFVRGIRQRRTARRLDTAYVADFSADPVQEPGRTATVWGLPSGRFSRRTGLWHLERPWDVAAERPEMHERWFDRVVEGRTWQALARTEPVHADRVVVLEPSVLLVEGDQPCAVTTDRVQVHLLPEDEELAGDVATVVRRWFGVEPEWVRPA